MVAKAVGGRRRAAPAPVQARQVEPNDRDPAVLELIAKASAVITILEDRGEASAADIADLTGEPLSSVYRLLQSLTGIGWVDRGSRRGMYRLGLLLLTVGSRWRTGSTSASPRCRLFATARRDRRTSFLCVRREARAVCVERLEGQAVRSLAMQLGSSLPLYAGAAPRSLLAFLPPAEQRAVLKVRTGQAGDPAGRTRRRSRPTSTRSAGRLRRLRRRRHTRHRRPRRPGVQPSRRAGGRDLHQRPALADPRRTEQAQHRADRSPAPTRSAEPLAGRRRR